MDLLPRREFLLSLPRRRVAAGALITDESGRVCLGVPNYRPTWLLPGGTVEAGESPVQGLARELREELGLVLEVGRLLALTHVTVDADDDHGGMLMIYDCGRFSPEQVASIVPQPEELDDVVFVEVEELALRCGEGSAARIRAALQARDDGTVAELGR